MKRTLMLLMVLMITLSATAQKKALYNLDSAKDNMDAYVKLRASLDTKEEVVFYATGSIYGYDPEKPWKHLFDFEMYNIARVEKMTGDSGWRLITREMLVYKDTKTGAVLSKWKNPWTGEEVEVFPVWNDPVNQTFKYGSFLVPFQRMGEGRICLYNDVPLSYPSPLKKAEWPDNSRSDVYQGAELFNFFCNEKDLQNKKISSINADISWSRFSDFLPWMKMGSRPGNLLYQSRGWKVKGGWNGLPKNLKDFVMANKPEYATAPATYEKPNMTSWRYFKKVMEERKKTGQHP
jgi:Protein of unknown function (DUF1838)